MSDVSDRGLHPAAGSVRPAPDRRPLLLPAAGAHHGALRRARRLHGGRRRGLLLRSAGAASQLFRAIMNITKMLDTRENKVMGLSASACKKH